jgi:hypothetical protein
LDGEPDRADEFDSMTTEEYAEHRGLQIANNPRQRERKTNMATKTELQEQLDGIAEVLNEAFFPDTTPWHSGIKQIPRDENGSLDVVETRRLLPARE